MWLVLSAVAVLLVAVAAFLFLRGRNAHSAGNGQHRAVAVLYFNNLTQDQSLNWLDSGLTDMLTTNLAQVKGLDVLSTERVMSAVRSAAASQFPGVDITSTVGVRTKPLAVADVPT